MVMDGQHLPDVEIPIIEISPGWPAEAVTTEDDYDDAFAFLMAAIAEIEYRIDVLTLADSLDAKRELARAKRALKYKRAGLAIIQTIRGRRSEAERRERQDTADRRVIEAARALLPPSKFAEILTLAQTKGETAL